jgi:hypothetical protein
LNLRAALLLLLLSVFALWCRYVHVKLHTAACVAGKHVCTAVSRLLLLQHAVVEMPRLQHNLCPQPACVSHWVRLCWHDTAGTRQHNTAAHTVNSHMSERSSLFCFASGQR